MTSMALCGLTAPHFTTIAHFVSTRILHRFSQAVDLLPRRERNATSTHMIDLGCTEERSTQPFGSSNVETSPCSVVARLIERPVAGSSENAPPHARRCPVATHPHVLAGWLLVLERRNTGSVQHGI